MLKIFTILAILALSTSYVVEPPAEDAPLKELGNERPALTKDQEELLLELLAADDLLIDKALSRNNNGIFNDVEDVIEDLVQDPLRRVLSTIAAVGTGGLLINRIGAGSAFQQPAPQQQPLSLVNPTINILPAGAGSSGTSLTFLSEPQSAIEQLQRQGVNVNTVGGNNNHLYNSITGVIQSSNRRNVTGIVDQSLRIATPAPIREFVTGILNVAYCNSIRRLLGRC